MTSQVLGRKVGLRFLRAKKSSSFLSLITAISVGGVAIGVMTLIVTLSVMSGFEHELKTRLAQAETHVMIEPVQASSFQLSTFFPDGVSTLASLDPSIRSVFPVLQTEVILRSGKKINGSVLKGVESAQLDWVHAHVQEWGEQQKAKESASLFMGAEMAFDMGVIPGDFITAVSPVESDGPLGAVPRVKRFFVQGIYKSGVPEQEMHVVFTDKKNVESFLKQEGILSHIELKLDELERAPKVAKVISTQLGSQYLVRPWQEINAHLFSSLKLERAAMFCILFFIIIVAVFNIVSTLTMMVLEKKKSLSILRAMGASKSQIASIFVWEALAIGFVGVGIGVFFGLGLCLFLSYYPIIELPEFYYDRSLPVVIEASSVCFVAGCALLIVMVGALSPAKKAAELVPIHGIKEG